MWQASYSSASPQQLSTLIVLTLRSPAGGSVGTAATQGAAACQTRIEATTEERARAGLRPGTSRFARLTGGTATALATGSLAADLVSLRRGRLGGGGWANTDLNKPLHRAIVSKPTTTTVKRCVLRSYPVRRRRHLRLLVKSSSEGARGVRRSAGNGSAAAGPRGGLTAYRCGSVHQLFGVRRSTHSPVPF